VFDKESDVVTIVDRDRTLETPRLLLEPLVPSHAAILYEPLRVAHLYTFIPQEPPASRESLERRYMALSTRRSPDGHDIWLNWALRRRDTDAYVGLMQATVHADHTAMLAYMVFVVSQRQGYAVESAVRVLTHLFDDYQVSVVAAEIDTRNGPSIRLVEALGFVRVAIVPDADSFKGTTSDEYRYELRSDMR